ncbi:hypothetical protein D3C81_1840800 [compost metagenome]
MADAGSKFVEDESGVDVGVETIVDEPGSSLAFEAMEELDAFEEVELRALL